MRNFEAAYPPALAGKLRRGQSAEREASQTEGRITQEAPKSGIERFDQPLLAIGIVRMPRQRIGITEAGHVRDPHAEPRGKRLDIPRPVHP